VYFLQVINMMFAKLYACIAQTATEFSTLSLFLAHSVAEMNMAQGSDGTLTGQKAVPTVQLVWRLAAAN
jgi:hypothetical protein